MSLSTTLKISFNAKAVQRGLASITKSVGNLASRFAQIGAGGIAAGFAGLTAGVLAFSIASSSAASEMEGTRAQLDLFTGSADKTNELLKELRKTAVESPLEMKDITEGARNLLTYGVAAGEVSSIVDQLSEVSAGNAERFGRLTYAFGQIASIGRLMGTELRQLTEAGFNPLESISKRTGETMLQLKKRMEDGGISVDEVKQSLIEATSEGGRFHGMNDRMSKTFAGRVSMMADQWNLLKISLGTGLNEGLKTAADAVTKFLPTMNEKFAEIGKLAGKAISEAVQGDSTRLAMIGDFIARSIIAGMDAAFQTLGSSAFEGLMRKFEELNPIRKIYDGERGSDFIKENRLSASAQMSESLSKYGVAESASKIKSYDPSTRLPSDWQRTEGATKMDNNNPLIKVLKEIETNTAGGAKM